MADVFLFANSSSDEAAHIPQTHTQRHRHIQRTPIWPATQAATDKALPSAAPTHKTHIKDNPQTATSPSPLQCAKTRRSLEQAHRHTHTTAQVHKHTHICRSLNS